MKRIEGKKTKERENENELSTKKDKKGNVFCLINKIELAFLVEACLFVGLHLCNSFVFLSYQ